jgi:hypothetical protein
MSRLYTIIDDTDHTDADALSDELENINNILKEHGYGKMEIKVDKDVSFIDCEYGRHIVHTKNPLSVCEECEERLEAMADYWRERDIEAKSIDPKG